MCKAFRLKRGCLTLKIYCQLFSFILFILHVKLFFQACFIARNCLSGEWRGTQVCCIRYVSAAASFFFCFSKNHLQKRLDDYEFPVYRTEFCPENRTEWRKRSSAFNCTEDTLYSCFPNENLTMLLEFCYTAFNIPIEEGNAYGNVEKSNTRLFCYSLLSAIKIYTYYHALHQSW